MCAAQMTAGHNALRGSGPGQQPAFEMRWHEWVILIMRSESGNAVARGFRNAIIVRISCNIERLLEPIAPDRRDDTKLGKM